VEWESVFAQVPDAALAYLKNGDDYAVGGLQVHVNWVLTHYRRVLDAIVAGRFAAVAPLDSAAEVEAMNRKAKAGLKPGERQGVLREMTELHAAVSGAAQGVGTDDWTRKAAVTYGEGQDPYPTSPEDVVGWLRDHYREHVQQCPDLVAEWRSLR
jgi:hypothetical protein